MSESYCLKLYISGRTSKSEQAIFNLERLCRDELDQRYELIIIDVLERPQLAEHEGIMATPTLIKELPPPLRRIIGDLSDKERVLLGLEIFERNEAPFEEDPANENETWGTP